MILSTNIKYLLKEYNSYIDKEHKQFFEEMIEELRIYKNVYTSFIQTTHGIHTWDCKLNSIENINICSCIIKYNRYILLQKLYNLYYRILCNKSVINS